MKKKYLAIISVLIVFTIFSLSGCIEQNPPAKIENNHLIVIEKDYHSITPTPKETQSQKEQNIKKCEEVAKQYYETHTYVENDVFDCDNMACDIWNILKTKGINAEIAIGNLELDDCGIGDWNHAWIIAEVGPNEWLAIECTGGYTTEDYHYYSAHFFNSPKNLRDFSQHYKTYQSQVYEYKEAIEFYNALIEEYNNADYYTQPYLESGLQVAKLELEKKEKNIEITLVKIETILEYG